MTIEPSAEDLLVARGAMTAVRDIVLNDGWDSDRVTMLIAQRISAQRAQWAVEFATIAEEQHREYERVIESLHVMEVRFLACAAELKRLKRQFINPEEP